MTEFAEMTRQKSEQAKPALGAKALEDQQARLEREAAALRANLRKRKEQGSAREESTGGCSPGHPIKGGPFEIHSLSRGNCPDATLMPPSRTFYWPGTQPQTSRS